MYTNKSVCVHMSFYYITVVAVRASLTCWRAPGNMSHEDILLHSIGLGILLDARYIHVIYIYTRDMGQICKNSRKKILFKIHSNAYIVYVIVYYMYIYNSNMREIFCRKKCIRWKDRAYIQLVFLIFSLYSNKNILSVRANK